MINNRKFWMVVIRFVAILWFLLALLTLFISIFPWFRATLLSFMSPSLGSFVQGFGAFVGVLWGIVTAFLYGLIGWFLWTLNESNRLTVVYLCALMLLFSLFRLDLLRGILLLATLFVTLYSKARRVYSIGGSRSFFRVRKSYSRDEWRW